MKNAHKYIKFKKIILFIKQIKNTCLHIIKFYRLFCAKVNKINEMKSNNT